MGAKSKIAWTDATWNPVVGCTKISPGCLNCYAEKMAFRLASMGKQKYKCVANMEGGWNNCVYLDDVALLEPLKWKKPKRIFVVSMGDLFHKDVPFEFIDKVLAITILCHQHIFQILTKRPARMKQYFDSRYCNVRWHPIFETAQELCQKYGKTFYDGKFENAGQNVWLGVTAENQEQADKRIPILLQIPAVVRFVSVEPMLGKIVLTRLVPNNNCFYDGLKGWLCYMGVGHVMPKLDWVICGGESGAKARPMHLDWVRLLRDQCASSDVPFFFKQWGSPNPHEAIMKLTAAALYQAGLNWGQKNGGRMLDGKIWDQYPEAK